MNHEPMPVRFQELADYNTECGRGVVHLPEVDERMGVLQEEFNVWARAVCVDYMRRRRRQGRWWRWAVPRLWEVTR